MRFELKVAARYLFSNKAQTSLLLGGVGIGVLVFVFMSALINGLASYQIEQTIGSIPHVTLEAKQRSPRVLPSDAAQIATVLTSNIQRDQIRPWREAIETAFLEPEVRLAVPVVAGNGLIARGQAVGPVSITGVAPEQLSDIASIAANLIAGSAELDPDGVLIGARLAANLSISVGQPVVLRSDRGRERTLRVRGIFRLGIEALDERVAYMNFNSAKALLDLDNGVSRIELKLTDINAATAVAARLAEITNLKVTSWSERNRRLFDAIQGQGRTGDLIKFFSIMTITIGVASALLLTTVRRRPEIGIMRSMGATQNFILTVFVLQGVLVGLLGAGLGAGAGWAFNTALAEFAKKPNGAPLFTLDPAQGNYLAAIIIATIASALAAILPARAAAKIDPVEAISQ